MSHEASSNNPSLSEIMSTRLPKGPNEWWPFQRKKKKNIKQECGTGNDT